MSPTPEPDKKTLAAIYREQANAEGKNGNWDGWRRLIHKAEKLEEEDGDAIRN